MNIKAIIASLVLGSSSVAMAAPSVTFTASAGNTGSTAVVRGNHTLPAPVYRPVVRPAPQPVVRPIYRPAPVSHGGWFSAGWRGGWNGWSRPVVQPIVYRAPVTLASGMSFSNEGRRFITVGSQAGLFGKLEINGSGTFIKQVYVQFDNGQEQVIRDLDRTLTNNECLTLDLDGGRRAIRRIVVYGNDLRTGWRRAPSAFTVTAA